MNATVSSTPAARPSSLRSNLEVTAIGLGALMAALTQTLILPVLPTIATDIGASATQSQWLLTSTLLVAAVAVPIVTRLADMFGRRLLLQLALGALTVGSVIDALTDSPSVMIVGRAIAGVSSAAIPLGISLLAAVLPPERRGSATALVSAMLGVGGALGLPLAGLIGDNFDYHVLFWIGAIGAVVSLVAVSLLVAEPNARRDGSIDWAGGLLLAAGLVCLVLPLAQGTSWGWGSLRTISLFVAAAVLLAALVLLERRHPNPLVDVRALTNKPVAVTDVASVFVGFALFASFVGTSNYVQAPKGTGYGFGASVLTAGLTLLPSGVLMLVLSPLAARLIARWGGARVLSVAGVVIAAGLVMRIVATGSLWEVVIGSSIVGAGTGIGYAALPALINTHTPAGDLAAANGINTLARSLGSTFASAVGGSLLTAFTLQLGPAVLPSLTGYRVLFAICAAASLFAAAGGVLINRLAKHDGTSERDQEAAALAGSPAQG